MSGSSLYTRQFSDQRQFVITGGSLLEQPVQALVNAANSRLVHGGGVARVIADAAGSEWEAECRDLVKDRGEVPTGGCAVTGGGKLDYQGIIHVVGPRSGDDSPSALISRGLVCAFDAAEDRGWRSLAFPAVSSGIFGVPPELCLEGYFQAVERFFSREGRVLGEIRLSLIPGPIYDLAPDRARAFWDEGGNS